MNSVHQFKEAQLKKYIPEKMIRKSRFNTFYELWGSDEKKKLIQKLGQLIKENPEYTDPGNYGHLCNLLTSLAMVMVLENSNADQV